MGVAFSSRLTDYSVENHNYRQFGTLQMSGKHGLLLLLLLLLGLLLAIQRIDDSVGVSKVLA